MVSNELILVGLLVLNVGLYVPLVFYLFKDRRQKVMANNLNEAFRGLELSIKQAIPDLPAGFTWEEAVVRLRSSGVKTEGMEGVLKGYEEYRYGESPLPDLDFQEVVRLANRIGGLARGTGRGASIAS